MIEITEVYRYESEACDCCEGWYNKRYELKIDGIVQREYDDLEELLIDASAGTMVISYYQTDDPDMNYD